MKFHLLSKRHYKSRKISIQFEFTGKNTNAIILSEDGIIIEALRHIDQESSFRVVRPNVKLLELPPPPKKFNSDKLNIDVEKLLEERYLEYERGEIEALRREKLQTII